MVVTAQAPELSYFSTNQDDIWCVNVPLGVVTSHQILSGLVEKPVSYKAFHFYNKIAILLNVIVVVSKYQDYEFSDRKFCDRKSRDFQRIFFTVTENLVTTSMVSNMSERNFSD